MAVINKNTQQILEERYFYKNPLTGETLEKTAEEMFLRVAKVAAQSEEDEEYWTNIFYELMNEQLVMPNTPTLIGAGYKDKCLSACSVIGRIPDSLDGIYDYAKYNALLTKSGLGIVQDLSNIRPKCEIIKSSGGQSAGVVNWMMLLNTVAETTKQGDKARRAANMVGLRFNHPDILEFIESKRNNSNFTNMNISVVISDEEMRLIKEDKDINLFWNGKIYRTVKAREIFNKLIDNMYNHGDPGVLFLDTMNKNNPFNLQDGKFKDGDKHYIHITNPCVTGDTEILTDKGYFPIVSMINKDVNIWNGYKFSKVTPKKTADLQTIMKVTFSNGCYLKCTPYHKFILEGGNRVECRDMVIGSKLIKYNFPIINGERTLSNAYTQGFFSGDGFICKNRKAKYISFYGIDKKKLEKYCAIISRREQSEKRNTYSVDVDFAKDFVPSSEYTIKSRLRWLEGIVDSDGGNNQDGSISISSINFKFMYELKFMLNTLGLDCTLNKSKDTQLKKFPINCGNKTYRCKDLYRITLSSSDISQLNKLGFPPKRVLNNSIPNRNAKRFIQVVNIETLETMEDVYCFTEEDNHSAIFNGVLTAQCGEQPLEAFEYCNLASINISKLYNALSNSVDWDMFEKIITNSIRFLDDIIDVNAFPVEQFKAKVLGSRKIGLGLTGYAELLVKNVTCKSTIDGLNRMISLTLRSGTRVEEIIDQLKGITCSACTRTTYKGKDGLSTLCRTVFIRLYS